MKTRRTGSSTVSRSTARPTPSPGLAIGSVSTSRGSRESPFWAAAARVADRFGWKVFYDCLDEHAGFPRTEPKRCARRGSDRESGGPVVTESDRFSSGLRLTLPDAFLLPNAADLKRSRDPGSAPDPNRLTVGYAGAVDDWFDFRPLAAAARLRPNWTLRIVGGWEGRRASRAGLPDNVVFAGERPYSEMPGIRASFDVEVIPFRLSPLTHATDPVKLYEALAAGRGVVATPMRALAPCGPTSFAWRPTPRAHPPARSADARAVGDRAAAPSRAKTRGTRERSSFSGVSASLAARSSHVTLTCSPGRLCSSR